MISFPLLKTPSVSRESVRQKKDKRKKDLTLTLTKALKKKKWNNCRSCCNKVGLMSLPTWNTMGRGMEHCQSSKIVTQRFEEIQDVTQVIIQLLKVRRYLGWYSLRVWDIGNIVSKRFYHVFSKKPFVWKISSFTISGFACLMISFR